jgi:hypothetical protein
MDTARICQALNDWPKEKQGRFHLYDPNRDCYCALGWLGHKAGMTDRELLHLGDFTVIYRKYGITEDEDDKGSRIWQANDKYKDNGFKTPKEAVQAHLNCET